MRWFVFASVLVLGACAGAPPQQAHQLPLLTFDVSAVGGEHSALHADSKGERAGRGAATGGLGGAGIGALIGLTCGPFAVYCVPALAGGGALAGGLGGAFHGLTGLDREEAERVSEVLDAIDRQRDFPLELERAVLGALPEEVRAEPGDAAVSLVVSIQKLELEQYVGEELSLLLQAHVRLNVSGARNGQRERDFSVGTKRALVERWVANEGALFDTELTSCIESAAELIAAWSRTQATDLAQQRHFNSQRGGADP